MAKLLSNTRVYGTATIDTQLFVSGTNSAHSTNTGALQVGGGIGVAGGGFFSGAVTATNFVGSVSGSASSANNITGGSAGQLLYQSAPSTTGFVGPGTAGQILVSSGTNSPVYFTTSSIQVGFSANLLGGAANQFAYQTAGNATAFATTGSMYVGNSVTATNVRGGTANDFVYQTAPGVTAFINTGSMYVGRAAVADTVIGGGSTIQTVQQTASAAYYMTFVDSNNSVATAESLYTTSSFTLNPSSGNVGLGTASAADRLELNGAADAARLRITNATSGRSSILGHGGSGFYWQPTNNAELFQLRDSSSNPLLTFNPNGGNVGIGTTGPSVKLHVAGSNTDTRIRVSADDGTNYRGFEIFAGATSKGGMFYRTTEGNFLQIWGPNTGLAAMYVDANNTVDINSNASVHSTATGALQVIGGIGVGGGGFFGGIVTATNFVGAFSGSSGQVETRQATANATHFLTFVDSNNAGSAAETIYTTSSFTVNPATGNVGIGTTSPDGKLDIATGGAGDVVAGLGGSFPSFTYRNGSGTWFHAGKHPSNDYFYIGSGATPTTNIAMAVDNSGNVGIGTTGPGAKLHVVGGAGQWVIAERSSKQLYINANWSDNNLYAQIAPRAADNMGLSLSSRDSNPEYLFITNGGRVQIGFAANADVTTAGYGALGSSNKLAINGDMDLVRFGSASAFGQRYARGSENAPANVDDGDRLGAYFFGGYHSTTGWINPAFIGGFIDGSTASASSNLPGRLSFFTAPLNGTRTERLRINSVGNVGLGTTTITNRLTVSGNIELDQILIKTAATEEGGALSGDGANSEFICVLNSTAYYAAIYPGTEIYETNIATGYTTIKVHKTTAPVNGTFSALAGYIYSSNMPINLIGGADLQNAIIPLSMSSTTFVNFTNRSNPSTYTVYSPFGNAQVYLYVNTVNGILGTAESSATVALNTIGTLTTNNLGFHYIRSTAPVIVSATQTANTDHDPLQPTSRIVYHRYTPAGIATIYGGTPTTGNGVSSTGADLGTGCVFYADKPLQGTQIADGSGGNCSQGVGIDYLSDTYALGGVLSDFTIVAPYPDTTVSVSYWSGSAWVIWDTIVLPFGKPLNPSRATRDGTNGPGVEASTISGSAANMASGATLWSFSGTKPFALWINDDIDDEIPLVGWMSKNIALKKQRNDSPVFLGNVSIGTTSSSRQLLISRPTETTNEQLEFRNEGGITTGNYSGIVWTQGSAGATILSSIRLNYNSSGSPDMAFNLRTASNVLFLKNDGNVGIGTNNPANRLQIGSVGASGYGGNDIAIGNGTQVMAFYQAASASQWYTNTNFELRPSGAGSTGNVGLGTAPSFRLHVSGTGFASSDFRAPIFYDSDNTAFYIDAASTSQLNNLTFTGTPSTLSKTASQRVDIGNVGGLDANSPFWIGYHWAPPNVITNSSGANSFPRTSFYFNYSTATNPSNMAWNMYTGNNNGVPISWNIGTETAGNFNIITNGTTKVTVLSGGNVGINNSSPAAQLHVIAPNTTAASLTWNATSGQIFRNEASEFALGLLNSSPFPLYIQGRTSSNIARDIVINPLGGNIGIGTTDPATRLHVSGSTRIDHSYGGSSLENGHGLQINGNYTNGQYSHRLRKWDDGGGVPLYVQFTSGTANTWANIAKFGPNGSDGSYLTVYGTGSSTSDFRAPIFYDSDNTAYYANLASTSYVNDWQMLNMSPVVNKWHTDSSGQARFWFQSGSTVYYRTGGNFIYRNSADSGVVTIDSSGNLRTTSGGDNLASFSLHVGGTGFASSDFRAPIFYDSNNTGYYVDPNSVSVLSRLHISQDGAGECCSGGVYTLSLAENTASTSRLARIQFHNSGVSEGFIALAGSGTRRMLFGDFQSVTMGIEASGNITAYSDQRLKKDLEIIPNALNKVEQLNGYTYTRIENEERHTGLIAQEVQKVLPEAVYQSEYLTLAYGNLAGLFVEAIKELNKKVEKLQTELDLLKNDKQSK